MKLGDLTGLVLPNTATGSRTSTASGQDDAAGGAWRREMERAQSDAWFLGVLPKSASALQPAASAAAAAIKPEGAVRGAQPGEPSNLRGHDAMKAASEARSHDHHPTAASRSNSAHSAQQPRGQRQTSAVAGAAAGALVAASSESAVQLQHSPDLALRLSSLTASPDAQEPTFDIHFGAPAEQATGAAAEEHSGASLRGGRLPVRVHVEGDHNQSTVWLGVDSAALAQLPDLAMAVRRWLTRAGYGEPTWICNGQPLSTEQLAEGGQSGGADAGDRAGGARSAGPMSFLMNQQTPGGTV